MNPETLVTLSINIEKEIRGELGSLINIQQKLDKNSIEYQQLLKQIKPLTIAQENIFKHEITVLKDLIGEIKTQDSPGRTISNSKNFSIWMLAPV